MRLTDIPNDVIKLILQDLPIYTLRNIKCTCSSLSKLIDTDYISRRYQISGIDVRQYYSCYDLPRFAARYNNITLTSDNRIASNVSADRWGTIICKYPIDKFHPSLTINVLNMAPRYYDTNLYIGYTENKLGNDLLGQNVGYKNFGISFRRLSVSTEYCCHANFLALGHGNIDKDIKTGTILKFTIDRKQNTFSFWIDETKTTVKVNLNNRRLYYALVLFPRAQVEII